MNLHESALVDCLHKYKLYTYVPIRCSQWVRKDQQPSELRERILVVEWVHARLPAGALVLVAAELCSRTAGAGGQGSFLPGEGRWSGVVEEACRLNVGSVLASQLLGGRSSEFEVKRYWRVDRGTIQEH